MVYPRAEEELAKGLSPSARWIIAIAMVFFGAIACLGAQSAAKPLAVYGVAAFCWIIAFACIADGKLRRTAGRIIGGVVFLTAAAYFVDQILGGPVSSGSRSKLSIINAIFFMMVFGLPGGYFAWKGGFRTRKGDEKSDIAGPQ